MANENKPDTNHSQFFITLDAADWLTGKHTMMCIRDRIRRKRQAHRDSEFLREKGERLVFVIRIRGVNEVPPKPRKILELFRLLQVVLVMCYER